MKKFKRKNPIYLNDPERKRAGKRWTFTSDNPNEEKQKELEYKLRMKLK
jgi:hypothetical protein